MITQKGGYGILANSIKLAFLCQLNIAKKDIGGADIHILNLLKAMSKIDELNIHVITLSKSVKKPIKKVKDGITYHILKSPKMPRTITGISIDQHSIIKKVNEIDPDIVHAQILGAPYGLAAMKLSKTYSTLLTVHTIVDIDARNRTGTAKEKIHDAIWRYLERKEIKRISNLINKNEIALINQSIKYLNSYLLYSWVHFMKTN